MTTTTLDCGCCDECREGACCENDVCTVKKKCDCCAPGQTFKGPGVPCGANTCTPDAGACCIDGVCSVKAKGDCLAAGGSFLGVGSTCNPDSCLGACCGTGPDGYGCSQTTKSGCADAGGWWFQGEGVPCVSNCPGPAPSAAITVTGLRFRPVDPPWKPGVEGEMLALNKTVVVQLPCSAGRSQCPLPDSGDSGPWRVDILWYMGYPSTGEAAGLNLYVQFYVRPNCSIYLASIAMRSGPNLSLDRGYQYARFDMGYTEDADTGMDNTPAGGCVAAGDSGGGGADFVGTTTNGQGDLGAIAPWDLTDVSLTFTYA